MQEVVSETSGQAKEILMNIIPLSIGRLLIS